MSVSAKTGCRGAHLSARPLLGLGGYPAVNGRGVGVAVIDCKKGMRATRP